MKTKKCSYYLFKIKMNALKIMFIELAENKMFLDVLFTFILNCENQTCDRFIGSCLLGEMDGQSCNKCKIFLIFCNLNNLKFEEIIIRSDAKA